MEGLYKGLVEGLGDEYSKYYTPEEAEEFKSDVTGEFCGLGAVLTVNDAGEVIVLKVYDGSSVISLVIDNAVRALYGEEDPTAINEVNTDNKNTEIFSITGVRVNKAQKGIYIINGKKTAVK